MINHQALQLMEYVNYFYSKGMHISLKDDFICLLAPFAPHLSEEMWNRAKHDRSVFLTTWPTFDESKIVKNVSTISIQVNGKLRGSIDVSVDLGKDEILNLAKKHNNVIKFLDNKEIIKEIYIPKKNYKFCSLIGEKYE